MNKYIYIIYMFLVLTLPTYAQDTLQNYVKTHVYLTPNPVYENPEFENLRDTINAQINVTYLDGLGRPVQQIAVRAGGDNKDIITHMEYDIYGRQVKQYLPYSTGSYDMMYDANALSHINTFYNTSKYENTTNPYSESFFEDSPLSRVKKTAAPGVPWKGNADTDNNPDNDGDHTVKMKYTLCVKSDYVRHFYVNFSSGNTELPVLSVNGYYVTGELYKTITKDENWTPADGINKTTEEYSDKRGHLILKRNYNSGLKHDTYYVYDKYNNLTYVIPPLASDQIVYSDELNNFLGVAYPWVSLSKVSKQLADSYNQELAAYDNEEILNVDLLDRYGGQGGFSIVPSADGGLAVNLNIITTQPMPLRVGEIVDLKPFGNFNDKELGRITGSGYEYYFLISKNKLVVDGYGEVPSQYLNTSLTGDSPLDYSKNYPWTSFCKGDTNVMDQYNRDILNLDNSEILTTYTPNNYHAVGGVSIALDDEDDFTISFNMNTDVPMELVSGKVFPLEFKRSLPDVGLGTVQGDGYEYEFSIKNNSLYVTGHGFVSHLNFWTTRRFYLNELIRNQVTDGLCYIYRYDERNRVVEKRVPGKGWEHLVYDRLDRVIATQDENQRVNNQWMFTKYEQFGRVAYTGLFTDALNRNNLQLKYKDTSSVTGVPGLYETRVKISDGFTKSGVTVEYTNDNYPLFNNIAELFTVMYYENYQEIDMNGLVLPTSTYPLPTDNTLGLPVASKVRVLGSQQWIYAMKAYDEKGREIWSHSKNNYLSSQDIIRTSYDFTNRIISTQNTHKKTGLPDFNVYNAYQYDRQGRVLKHRQSETPMTGWDLGPYEHVIAENHYDELGMLESKGVGGKTNGANLRLQTVDYTYNVRGWLKGINNISNNLLTSQDLFAFKINYNTTDLTGSTGLFNGNISETRWKTKHDNVLRAYSYTYDALNRLKSANYNGSSTGGYTEGPITYDKNGNIMSLKRYGHTSSSTIDVIDNLTYTYRQYTNQLLKVGDSAGSDGFNNGTNSVNDYDYDPNGNMRYDLNKKIGEYGSSQYITYNHLNLPTKIYFGSSSNKYIDFVYDATGVKLEKKVTDVSTVTTTQYDNGFVYEKVNTGSNKLKYFNHPEGYVKAPTPVSGTYNPDNFEYIYQYKDHLGNVRLSYKDNNGDGVIAVNGSEIVKENNYYAFGMEHAGYGYSSTIGDPKADKYKYNGKELQDELGLNMYDYGARNYNPAIGRWFNVDPKAEEMRRFSPYAYVYNNPVYFIDPDGMKGEDWFVNGKTGDVVYLKDKSSISQSEADKYGIGNAKNWNRLGADNMFGNKVEYGSDKNILDNEFVRVEGDPSSFMKRQGYAKAENVNIEEKEIVSGGKMGAGEDVTLTVNTLEQKGESKITYVKPDKLNTKSNLQTELYDSGKYNSIEVTRYNLTKPYGQNNSETAVYGEHAAWEAAGGILGLLLMV